MNDYGFNYEAYFINFNNYFKEIGQFIRIDEKDDKIVDHNLIFEFSQKVQA